MSDHETTPPALPDDDAQLELPEVLSILPLQGMVVYPNTIVPLAVGQEQSVHLIDDAAQDQQLIALVALRSAGERPRTVQLEDIYPIGTAAVVHKLVKLPDQTLRVAVQGLQRIEIVEVLQTEPYMRARVRPIPEQVVETLELEALMRNVTGQISQLAPLIPQFPEELLASVLGEEDPLRLAYLIASFIRISTEERQTLLALPSAAAKLTQLSEILARELQVLRIGQQIQSQVQTEMNKTQREYVLREQLKAIRRELGETDQHEASLQELAEQIAAAGMSDEAHKQALTELQRLENLPTAAAEYSVIRTYLEWLIALPWQRITTDLLDIVRARQVLDEDHYGLDEIKERILEYLAVRDLRQRRSGAAEIQRGAILCFVGPPGVGKTSLGRSIARAMGREFARVALGGVADQAEIRGHRRTYVGAMPGTIIQALRRVGVRNPVLMLDEIDKLGSDHRGDPTAALLEVLDPAQNDSFRDHYLDVAWNLSPVLFIATANTLDTIPVPLRDRLEIIQLSGYTLGEKLEIARRYLVPEQLLEHALTAADLELTDEALSVVIEEYTREAGVRSLEREIASLCRKVARIIAEREARRDPDAPPLEPIVVDGEMTRMLLGRRRFFSELSERTERPGVVTGLVYTPVGGDIIFIEATRMPGKGGFLLTGQLGDIMRESAQAALSWVRAEALRLGLDPDFSERWDLHLHVPAGAIPKDGPSAGVAMATALVSLLSDRPVRDNVAMTGEITLRGRVLPVGGIKEKVLAAHRAGVRTIILPCRNERDLDDLPSDLRDDLSVILVERVDEVIEAALAPAAAT